MKTLDQYLLLLFIGDASNLVAEPSESKCTEDMLMNHIAVQAPLPSAPEFNYQYLGIVGSTSFCHFMIPPSKLYSLPESTPNSVRRAHAFFPRTPALQ